MQYVGSLNQNKQMWFVDIVKQCGIMGIVVFIIKQPQLPFYF